MSLFKKAENSQAFVKCGALGFPGSGKTFSTIQWVVGLKAMTGSKAPVCFFDTENGSDFFVDQFNALGIELMQVKSRAFVDAVAAYDEALKLGADVLIFDSVTHIWREFTDSYKKRKNRSMLTFQDWGFLKGPDGWQKFTDKFLNAPIHTFIAGRAGYEYEMEVNTDTGKKEYNKAGTKMKVEGEFGYEPSLLVELIREKISDSKDPDAKGWSHKMVVLKDRTNTINGQEFEFTAKMVHQDPTCVFKAIAPHFQKLNIGGAQMGIDVTRTSDELFNNDGEPKAEWARKQKQILIEEIYGLIEGEWPGMDKDAKQKRNDVFVAMSEFVGSATPRSKTAFESLGFDAIKKAHWHLCIEINKERQANGVLPEHMLTVPDYANTSAQSEEVTS